MFFKQIRHIDDNFSYVIAELSSKTALVIDPSFNSDEIIQLAREYNFDIKYVLNTHHHWDHIVGNKKIKLAFNSKVIAHKLSKIEKDIEVVDGDTLELKGITLKVIHTPGHTRDSICLMINNKLFTGDTLFVGECGRTDLPGGNAEDMYKSLFNILMKLDDEIEIYPGHDYGPRSCSTIGFERKTNYTLEERSLKDFIFFMKEP